MILDAHTELFALDAAGRGAESFMILNDTASESSYVQLEAQYPRSTAQDNFYSGVEDSYASWYRGSSGFRVLFSFRTPF